MSPELTMGEIRWEEKLERLRMEQESEMASGLMTGSKNNLYIILKIVKSITKHLLLNIMKFKIFKGNTLLMTPETISL